MGMGIALSCNIWPSHGPCGLVLLRDGIVSLSTSRKMTELNALDQPCFIQSIQYRSDIFCQVQAPQQPSSTASKSPHRHTLKARPVVSPA